jgi:hypothetical protein
MTYIYLDIWYMEKILQWHYQQGWSTEEIEEELRKPKYKLELSLIYRWRALQGIINPQMWDFPQEFDKDIKELSSDIQLEMTANVKKQKNTLVKSIKDAALTYHTTSDKVVFQSEGGKKRLSLQTSAEAHSFKRQKGDKTPGLGSHVDSSKGYPPDRTTISPAPYQGQWNEKFPEHQTLSYTPEGKDGKGKSGKKGSKGKGKGKTPKGKGYGKGKQAYQQSASGEWWKW